MSITTVRNCHICYVVLAELDTPIKCDECNLYFILNVWIYQLVKYNVFRKKKKTVIWNTFVNPTIMAYAILLSRKV
jgi:hypothetical protein